jgi:hypothetical protein
VQFSVVGVLTMRRKVDLNNVLTSAFAAGTGHVWSLRRAAAQDRQTSALRHRAAGGPQITAGLHGLRVPQFRVAAGEASQRADHFAQIFSPRFGG